MFAWVDTLNKLESGNQHTGNLCKTNNLLLMYIGNDYSLLANATKDSGNHTKLKHTPDDKLAIC